MNSRKPASRRWVKLIVAYDGTRFKGWQKGNGRTVQGVLEQTLITALPRASGGAIHPGTYTEADLQLAGAGRTDAGVHAEGQAASAILPASVSLEALLSAVNTELPSDIAIKSITPAPDRFHARYHATSRTYRYSIICGPVGNPFRAAYTWNIPEKLNLETMKQAAALLQGTHDFTSFTADKSKSNRVRTITDIHFEWAVPELHIYYTADSFLWNQVRIMTMVLVQAGLGTMSPTGVAALLEAKNRSLAPEPAPAKGLCLYSVSYKE
ncbi:tRNA pseudouridine(38-40) synthase TruA [Gracilinema caldarium]|uniref:tRNA pseudouridine synthase A n=1 Tax=Gracilinema caldarium (strain ATCC 51460 / DSM 7334 / H1) TaxID=744872 RepID=F8F005_GRAC1|nr:tRNA pseudouridine(38-40) synthase TruA [Gracilinema caldarium]AEJ18658.1 tRNA pseudouridine synthase A [Gracilinema caldarium DSM 7334]